jgi:uncharacterized lipoprotein
MIKKSFTVLLITAIFAITGCDKQEETAQPVDANKAEQQAAEARPFVAEKRLLQAEATVTAINHETRQVTLENAQGETTTFIADENVRNLAQVEVGDVLTVEYLEGVVIEVVDPNTELGSTEAGVATRAEAGQKPGAGAVSETSIVVQIVAIDLDNGTATVKNAEGKTKTVKARNPENLKKVAVGDKVMVTFTEAIAITVNEKQAEK